MENIKNVVEALIFSAGAPIAKKELIEKVPELTGSKLDQAVKELKKKYGGESGVLLLEFNGKLQFSSSPAYGDIVAEALKPLRERQLSRTLLEVLATVAYRQPVTRLELEEMRGKSDGTTTSCEYAISGLLKAGLIEVVGRKETVGRPFLYGTTDEFLKKFGLSSLEDLPDASEVLEKLKEIYAPDSDTLFRTRTAYDEEGNLVEEESEIAADELAEEEEEIPEFLAGEKIEVFE
ncbi:MAG TPA: SMC-Scp complex subunit ScpB [Candidatus Limadaptatus stercoripullorum]|uniref:SMC-Scp complex subunit ScpB n=1 Tax=Candidatus Limadaptatus stercoripullorum TaxID=2840846 RepID=A0A9D1SX11_9FIRM|nr:SMC-Scp complex subunit ScpB [Candidatus Limadaptatus stercoripullorum]